MRTQTHKKIKCVCRQKGSFESTLWYLENDIYCTWNRKQHGGGAGRQEYKGHVGHPIALYYRDIDNGKQTQAVINEINWFFVVHGDARFA